MKPIPKFFATVFAGALFGAFLVWLALPRYHFMTSGGDIPILYRCDRWTGNVTAAVRNYNTKEFTWHEVVKSARPLFTAEDFLEDKPAPAAP